MTSDLAAYISTAALARFVELAERRRGFEAELKAVKAESDALEAALLDQFAEAGVSSMRVNGVTVYLHKQIWASAIDGNYDAACAALADCGLGDLVQRRFNTNTLSAWVREQAAEGKELPAILTETIKVTDTYALRTRKSA